MDLTLELLTRREIRSPTALMIVEARKAYWNPVTTPVKEPSWLPAPDDGGSVTVAMVRRIASPTGKPTR